MQPVSPEWITANTKKIMPLTDAKLYYYVEDQDIKNEVRDLTFGALTDNWDTTHSVLPELITKSLDYNRYITLDNAFILDGESVPLDQTTSLMGAIGNASSATSSNMSLVYVRFLSTITETLDKITIVWSSCFGISPYKVRVEFINGSSYFATFEKELGDNEFITTLDVNMTGFNSIRVGVIAGQTNTQIRIEKIVLGDIMIFDKADIMKIEQTDIVEPNNFTLPTHKLSFEIDNTDGRFNPDNPTGIYSYLEEGQEINLTYGLKINNTYQYINGGVYFLTGWNIPQNGTTATFEAGSKLDFMNDIFTGGSTTAKSHYDALLDVIGASYVVSNWFDIDSTLLTKNCYTSLVNGLKINEIIQMICNAERIKLYVDRDGIVHIDTLFDGDISALTQESYTISEDISYKAGEYEISRPLKDVTITYATDINTKDVKETTSSGLNEGVSQTLQNLLVSQQATAQDVNNQIINVLTNSKKISGSFRPDIRLDVWDKIYITNKYAQNLSVLITELTITYNGIFNGTYKGIIEG